MEKVDIYAKTYKFETSFDNKDVIFYNVKKDPFKIYGLYDYKRQEVYRRLPESVAKATSPGVERLALDTAGGRLRFSTDSPYIIIKVVMPMVCRFPHMPLTGTSGIDVYVDDDGGSHFVKAAKPDLTITDGYEFRVSFKSRKMRCLTVNFPSYNPVDALYIGLSETAKVGRGKEYVNKKPIVFYGSSITQGGCSSRPGLIYQNHISRRYNLDYIDLGFSGSGRAEIPIVSYMASLDMLAFVSDYDHNAPNPEYLRETHSRMYDMIREAHPDIPYIMISKPDFNEGGSDVDRRDVIIDSYRRARELGDNNVYFIDGEGFFRGPFADSCTVDGCHPNDLGFSMMADKIGRTIERAFRKIEFGGEDGE